MKTLSRALFLVILFYPAWIYGQSPKSAIYSQVAISASSSDQMARLAQSGLPIDHFEKKPDQKILVVLSQEEIGLLSQVGLPFQILIPDMTQHFLENNPPIRNAMACGLQNFDYGDMGGYYTYDNLIAQYAKMDSLYPDLVHVLSIGQTHEDRDVWAIKISDNAVTDESDTEAVVFYDAMHHAREPIAMEATIYYMWWLLENYTNDSQANYLVDHRELYFVPLVNPDGYAFNELNSPNGGGFWRKNRSPNPVSTCIGVDLNRNYGFNWGPTFSGSSGDPCSST